MLPCPPVHCGPASPGWFAACGSCCWPASSPKARWRSKIRSSASGGSPGAREFDFAGWTLAALGLKAGQSSLGASGYLAEPGRRELVLHYLDLIGQSDQLRSQIAEIYADPNTPDPPTATAAASEELRAIRQQMASLQPAAEAVLQEQVADTLASIGLGLGGEMIPPVSFHFSQLPLALIVSPPDRSSARTPTSI